MHKPFLLLMSLMTFGTISFSQQLGTPTSLSANSGSLVSRAPDMQPWKDPALQHNKLIQQQTSDGLYKLIGPYKVVGNAFLMGEHLKGDMFSSEAQAYNIFVSYNTYNQDVEFYSVSNPDKPLVREAGTLDSFTIQQDIATGIDKPMKFIYGPLLGTKDKNYYQAICSGERFTFYKRYKSDLDYVSNNLGQTELRQFDLQTEYFYSDKEGKGLKKIKLNAVSVTKEFKSVTDLSDKVSDTEFTVNPEGAMCKTIGILNQFKKGF